VTHIEKRLLTFRGWGARFGNSGQLDLPQRPEHLNLVQWGTIGSVEQIDSCSVETRSFQSEQRLPTVIYPLQVPAPSSD
jgi:hypothetical protein